MRRRRNKRKPSVQRSRTLRRNQGVGHGEGGIAFRSGRIPRAEIRLLRKPRIDVRRVPRRPKRVELAVLTVLADTYGAEMLSNSSLGYVLRLFARHGGVVLAQ